MTSKLQQVGINRAGQPLTKTVLRLDGGQKKPAGKNPFGEIRQEIWVGTMAQTLSSQQSILRGFTSKINIQTKINLASAKGKRLVLSPKIKI